MSSAKRVTVNIQFWNLNHACMFNDLSYLLHLPAVSKPQTKNNISINGTFLEWISGLKLKLHFICLKSWHTEVARINLTLTFVHENLFTCSTHLLVSHSRYGRDAQHTPPLYSPNDTRPTACMCFCMRCLISLSVSGWQMLTSLVLSHNNASLPHATVSALPSVKSMDHSKLANVKP